MTCICEDAPSLSRFVRQGCFFDFLPELLQRSFDRVITIWEMRARIFQCGLLAHSQYN
jgi:hypothetical protein